MSFSYTSQLHVISTEKKLAKNTIKRKGDNRRTVWWHADLQELAFFQNLYSANSSMTTVSSTRKLNQASQLKLP